mgnify:CR=1 FL=1
MSALVAVLLYNVLQQGGESMSAQPVKTEKKHRRLKGLLRRLMSSPTMTPEEWERLEGKKKIASSEQTRIHMRIH